MAQKPITLLRAERFREAMIAAIEDIAAAYKPAGSPEPSLAVIAAEAEIDRVACNAEHDLGSALLALEAWRKAWLRRCGR